MEFKKNVRTRVWIHLAQDRDQWRAFVNTVMSLWVSKKKSGCFLISWVMISFLN